MPNMIMDLNQPTHIIIIIIIIYLFIFFFLCHTYLL